MPRWPANLVVPSIDRTVGEERAVTGTKRMKPGDKVAVPWGLYEIIGEVLEVYGPPQRPHAFVRIPVHGPSGETLDESDISFPADWLRIVTPA
jgi:hypothetical protein